ncbi:MAG TPA: hypothetical protein VH143_19390 [Kofleriaceae bacterium]|jgi:hypothetical protein|nr:hypothetical protein [Kofleriaceae bacterium]
MKLVVTAALVLVTSFALAIGCHHDNEASTTPPPSSMAPVGATTDAAIPVIDSRGPMGAGNGTTGSMPGTNQP